MLKYEPKTGLFRWLVWRPNGIKVGDIAGADHGDGYISIGVFGKIHLAHRLAWLYITGEWPKDQIDHRNRVRNDNRWRNLREADDVLNRQNIEKPRSHNTTGFLGVSRRKDRFTSQIRVNGKSMFLGYHNTPELAYGAYLKAKRKFHEGCMI